MTKIKAKRLTKAQKEKIAKQKKLVDAEKRRQDPFYINPDDVPAGQAYQWFSLKIMGEEAPAKRILDNAIEAGWKYVPFSRHRFARDQNSKGKIVVDDNVLMEHSRAHVEEQLQKDRDFAKFMLQESKIKSGVAGLGSTVSESFLAAKPYKEVPLDAPPVVVEVTLQFRMDRDWQDAAAMLWLTDGQYAYRRIVITHPILACKSYDDVFETFNFELR